MSRPRPASRTNAFSEDQEVMTTVWHELVTTMRKLPPVEPGTRLVVDEDGPIRPLGSVEAEKATLDQALEQIEMLIALRRNEEQAIELARHTAGQSHASLLSSNNGIKRKRRMSLSFSASPAPNPIDNALSLNSPVVRGATPGGKDGFKSKVGDGPGGASAVGGGGGGLKKRDPHDRTKYVIADWDDPSVIFHADLRNMVPLPDPNADPSSPIHPNNIEDFHRGRQVLALFPETTTLYRAIVVHPPAPVVRLKNGEYKSRYYKVKFEDDEEQVRDVAVCDVVKFPGS